MYEVRGEKIFLFIKAQPNASKNQFGEILDGNIKLKVKAPPVEGAANKEIIKFLSKYFKLPKSDIEIKGERSKIKTIIFPYSKEIIEKLNKLKAENDK